VHAQCSAPAACQPHLPGLKAAQGLLLCLQLVAGGADGGHQARSCSWRPHAPQQHSEPALFNSSRRDDVRVEEDLVPLLRAAFNGAFRLTSPPHKVSLTLTPLPARSDPHLDGQAIAQAHATATAVAAAFTTGSASGSAEKNTTDSAPATSLSSWLLPRPPRCA
jgi:hypothetical protein